MNKILIVTFAFLATISISFSESRYKKYQTEESERQDVISHRQRKLLCATAEETIEKSEKPLDKADLSPKSLATSKKILRQLEVLADNKAFNSSSSSTRMAAQTEFQMTAILLVVSLKKLKQDAENAKKNLETEADSAKKKLKTEADSAKALEARVKELEKRLKAVENKKTEKAN